MIKTYVGQYEIIQWEGREYYRFGPQNWCEVVNLAIMPIFEENLEQTYQKFVILRLIDQLEEMRASGASPEEIEKLEDDIGDLQMNLLVGELF
jgi:hypothetical protein